jgi:acyl-coenzyme A synthetase/AMP-(fatty) acid ligase
MYINGFFAAGEPLPTAAWEWYYKAIGKEKCVLVDTYWQTGTTIVNFHRSHVAKF